MGCCGKLLRVFYFGFKSFLNMISCQEKRQSTTVSLGFQNFQQWTFSKFQISAFWANKFLTISAI